MNGKNKLFYYLIVIFLVFAGGLFVFFKKTNKTPLTEKPASILEEADKMSSSKNSNWWLNSGGVMYFSGTEFRTNFGKLPKDSKWQKRYAKSNSKDTDGGYYPQNIFRLVTRSQWKNLDQSVYFSIDKINLSQSSNRNESNGVLLFNRYQDGDNLYYAGIRVDGHAIIKKKIDEKYFTLAEKEIISGDEEYDEEDSPNRVPLDAWMGLKSELRNIEPDTVSIKLFFDVQGDGGWKQVLEAKDEGDKYGPFPFSKKGYAGIRTDFMDVKFRDYKISEN